MRVKSGLAEMLKGGVIMDVTTAEQAQDRRGVGGGGGDGARACPRGHPRRGRGRAHGRPDEDPRDPGGGLDPGDGQGPDRALRRGAGPGGARGRLHRRERGADARRRAPSHRQVGLPGAVRLRLSQPRRGAAAPERGRGHDPDEGRGGNGGYRQRRPAHARRLRGHPPAPHAGRGRALHGGQGARRPRWSWCAGWPRTGACRS